MGSVYKVHLQISVYTNVQRTEHVLFILSKISKNILGTCLRAFVADIPKIFKNVQPQLKKTTENWIRSICYKNTLHTLFIVCIIT